MPPQDELDIFEDAEEGKTDILQLELHKEEKETKPPITISKLILIFTAITAGSIGLVFALAAIVNAVTPDSLQDFSEWISIFMMMFGGIAIIAGGIAGFWGGQRNIPIRLVSPSDASVVGKGLLVCGYTIEECIDNEIELTIYDNKQEKLHEELLAVDKQGIFSTEVEKDLGSSKKTTHIVIEAWMVSEKTKQMKFAIKKKKLDDLNVFKEGIKIGKIHFFARIYKDFEDKAKAIFDPKRKEKGVIENVEVSDGRTVNIFAPTKSSGETLVPFSIERVAKMRQNALYFDIKRSRRIIYSLILFVMGAIYFIYPAITTIIS